MNEVIVSFVAGVLTTLVIMYSYWMWVSHQRRLVINDPTDDEEYLEIVRQLKCPDCDSTDFRYEEVSDLKWINGEDRFCICNHCGRRFSDGK